jgi:putative sporulation protein YtxC
LPKKFTRAYLTSKNVCSPIYIEPGCGRLRGDKLLIEIYFQEKLDAKNVYKHLCMHQKKRDIRSIDITYDGGNLVSLIPLKNNDFSAVPDVLIPVLIKFIIKLKEDQWMLSLISNLFYFKDFEEQQQILHIAQSIIDGERSDIPNISPMTPRETFIEEALKEFLQQSVSFSFESFVKFRLRKYHDRLLQYVELAIEEYKLEQEYQNFIQNLRDFVRDREPKLTNIHLLHDQQFIFMDDQMCEMTREEIVKLIDRKLIQSHPMYIDSTVLAPLVSIAPSAIYIYTNNADEGMIQTIQNIFQERVRIFSISYLEKMKRKFPET